MKLTDITSQSIKTISNKELFNLHFRIHQLYAIGNARSPQAGYLSMLEEKHWRLVAEIQRRGYTHTTPLSTEEKLKALTGG